MNDSYAAINDDVRPITDPALHSCRSVGWVSSTYTESFEAGADTGSMREPSHVLFALMRLPDRRLPRSRLEIFAHVPYGSLPLSNGVVVGKSAHGLAGTPRVKADRKRCA